ncbi:hypothetical protein ASD72_18315 [Pseudoxanthomonas sp. Root630]|nr:hypothetical protein ASD72_18315 [Pseudoxanthomonas sp. Root630]
MTHHCLRCAHMLLERPVIALIDVCANQSQLEATHRQQFLAVAAERAVVAIVLLKSLHFLQDLLALGLGISSTR